MLDKIYWNQFYKKHQKQNVSPSDFCCFVLNFLPQLTTKPLRILDAGCGSGRDSYTMGADTHTVVAVDTSGFLPQNTHNVIFFNDDFTTHHKDAYDLIYSRFTFHSITNEQQKVFLASIQKRDTILCIETRSDQSAHEQRVHGDEHYRNFTNYETLRKQLIDHHFNIHYMFEGNDLAVYNTENPVCIRVIAQRL